MTADEFPHSLAGRIVELAKLMQLGSQQLYRHS